MNTSDQIDKIADALAKAQGQMKPAAFDRENPHYKNRYATLTSITEAARPSLSANGIAIVQGTAVEFEPLRACVTTMLLHVSGQWLSETLALRPVREDPQGVGSALTYARRYSLAALVGIVAEEDDDGEMAVGEEKPGAKAFKRAIEKKGGEGVKSALTPDGDPKPVPPKPGKSDRVGKMREIFAYSARLNQSPDVMKGFIGEILSLDRPIKSSEEIPDDKIDAVLARFREEVAKIGLAKAA